MYRLTTSFKPSLRTAGIRNLHTVIASKSHDNHLFVSLTQFNHSKFQVRHLQNNTEHDDFTFHYSPLVANWLVSFTSQRRQRHRRRWRSYRLLRTSLSPDKKKKTFYNYANHSNRSSWDDFLILPEWKWYIFKQKLFRSLQSQMI